MTQEQNVLKDLEWSVRNHNKNSKKKKVHRLRSLFIRNAIELERKPNSLFPCLYKRLLVLSRTLENLN